MKKKRFFANRNQYSWYTSPFLFSILFSLIYIIINPGIFNPYSIEERLLPKDRVNSNQYYNLDADEYEECISFKTNISDGAVYIEINNKNKYHLKKDYSMEAMETFYADYDNDSFKEIYFCTNHADSLFLSSFDYKYKKFTYKYLGNVKKLSKGYKSIGFLCEHDYNNDSYKEIYFYVNTKLTENFRSIIRYDRKNNELKKSPYIESLIINAFSVKDKGKVKFVYTTWGLRKLPKFTYSDSLSYIKAQYVVLDDNLDFLFKPIQFDGENKTVGCLKLEVDGNNLVCIFVDSVKSTKKGTKNKTLVELYTLEGIKKKSCFIDYDIFIIKNAVFTLKDKLNDDIYISLRQGGILKMDKNLKILKHIYIKDIEIPILGFMGDIDGDGSNEMFFHDNFRKNNVIVKTNFTKAVYFTRPKPFDAIEGVYLISNVRESKHNSVGHDYSKNVDENIYFESKYLGLFLRYYKNPNHWYNYLYLALFFFFVFTSVWFIRYLVAKNMREKYEVRNRIAELRFKNVSNQMSPHFTMNAMNSIASLIYKEDKEKAYDYLSKFAMLMKISLLDASKSTRTLNEEIVFVRAYLELQKLRFKDKIDFLIINEDPSVSKLKLMPFIVQTFVENAIKHGIKDISKTGIIRISVLPQKEGVMIEVEDNGVGRKAAMLNRTMPSTGKGVSLVKEYMEVINKKDNRHMKIDIIDLFENNEASGTRVMIFIDYFEGEE